MCKTVKSALGYNRTRQTHQRKAKQSFGKESWGRGEEFSPDDR